MSVDRSFKMMGRLTLSFQDYGLAHCACLLLSSALESVGEYRGSSWSVSPPEAFMHGEPPSPPFFVTISAESSKAEMNEPNR